MFAQASWYFANPENLQVFKLISQVIKDFASSKIKQASSLFDCDIKLDDNFLEIRGKSWIIFQVVDEIFGLHSILRAAREACSQRLSQILDRGGIKRAQELANEKGESALKNLKYLPRSGFRSALEDMVMFNLENID
ncbi:hypothetical protein F2Q69_00063210 [Brassica cretica]|uniref:Uncharacterized protein n=1 Tax=Brassica cretica TaxID=69181 RepID=A0A8S9RMF6_BRACR|nr:hypothetical protein F2Q69_00063210 [Brassica cretica]